MIPDIYSYSLALRYLKSVSKDIYVRMMLRTIALELYMRHGSYSDLYTKMISTRYPIDKLIDDIGNRGSELTTTFLSYTIMRLVEPDNMWSIYITNRCYPFLMSKDYQVITNSSSISLDDISNIVRSGYKKVCSIDDLRCVSINIPLERNTLYVIPKIPFIYAERDMRYLLGNLSDREDITRRMLSPGVDPMTIGNTDIPYNTLYNIRTYAMRYRIIRSLDYILTRIPPVVCRKPEPIPPKPRNKRQPGSDIDIITHT